MYLNRTYSADGSNSTKRDHLQHSTAHTPTGPLTSHSTSPTRVDHKTPTATPTEKIRSDHRLHPTRASTDKAAMRTNVPEVDTSVVPQPDIPNSTSKNPMNSVTYIQDLAEEANCNCKVSADEVTVNEVTTSYDSISNTARYARTSVAEDLSFDNFTDMNAFRLFRIGRNIKTFFFISIFPLCFLCNIVCFLTMIQKHNRHFSTCVFMTALAVNDNLVLLLGLFTWATSAFDLFPISQLECSLVVYLYHVLWAFSSYIIVTMTFDKMYAIVWPHKSKEKCTATRARITVVVAAFLVIVFFVPLVYFAGVDPTGAHCIRYSQEAWYVTLYAHLSMIFHPLFPFISVVTLNTVILLKVFKRETSGITNSSTNQKVQKQLIIMLLIISSTYLILTVPFEAREIYSYYISYGNSPEDFAFNFFILNVTRHLIILNSGINFFLYLLSGRKFKNDLQILLSG